MGRSLRWPAICLLVATPALAQLPAGSVVESFELDDAQDLVTACTVPAGDALYQTANGFCLGYLTGAMQLYRAAVASPNVENFVCPGHPVSRTELRDVFLAWAAANSERLNEPAVDALLRAAVARFPCQE